MIVGRDPRFLGETFCSIAAEILAAHGITPLVIGDAAPTPAIAYAVIRSMRTGPSTLPPRTIRRSTTGSSFPRRRCPALPEVTQRIEAEIAAFDNGRGFRQNKTMTQPCARTARCVKHVYLARLAKSLTSMSSERPGYGWFTIRCGARRADIRTLCCAMLASRSLRFTTIAMCFSADMLPSLMIICWKLREKMREDQGAHRHCDRWRC